MVAKATLEILGHRKDEMLATLQGGFLLDKERRIKYILSGMTHAQMRKNMWYWRIVSLGLAGILDLAVGIFIAHVLSVHFAHPLEWWQYAIGALLGAAPDIDLLLCFFGYSPNRHHEYLTHRPLFGIPVAILLGWFFGGTFWACVAGIGVFWHYLHDTEGFLFLYDNGIGWCWPFSKKYWGVRNARIVSRMFHEEANEQESGFETIYEGYVTPTRRSVIEFSLTSMCLGYVASSLFGLFVGIAIMAMFWLTILLIWGPFTLRVRA